MDNNKLPRSFTGICISRAVAVIAWVTMPLFAPPAPATNGLNQLGFGAESMGMGGADLAVARDTTAMNTNPAGLTQITGQRLDQLFAVADVQRIRHKDGLGNDTSVDKEHPFLGNVGYARRISGRPITAGIALFAQGGSGIVYKNLITPFGTRDDLRIDFRVARITPGVAWQVNDRLSIGGSLVGTYSQLNQKVFPETSFFDPADPSRNFFGIKLKKLRTFETGIKLGLMYRLSERVTLGAAYNSEVELELKGGKLIANMAADPAIGTRVTYRDVKATGVDQPEEFGVGVAYQASEKLLLALELNWINWSSAVDRANVRATKPDNPAAPPELNLPAVHDWRDQYVVAMGGTYDWDSKTVLRAGFNYGRNPIPDENINPLLSPIAEYHLTLGAGRELSREWRVDAALEYQIKNKTTYTNTASPFGPNAQEEVAMYAIHLMASRAW